MSDDPKNQKKLTDSAVSKMAGSRLRDTEITGLVVSVRKTGKYFYLEYKSPVTSTYRKHPLGKFGNITTQQARELARIAAGQIAQGTDPQEVKHQQRAAIERQKMETLRAFLQTAYREVTNQKTADEVTPVILNHFPQYLDKPMSSITAWSLEKWKREYPGKPGGANRVLSRLRGVLTKAVKAGLLEKSPMSEVKKLKEDKSQKIRYLSHTDEKKLMSAIDARQEKKREERLRYIKHREERNYEAPPPFTGEFVDYFKPLVIVGLNTGLRRGELFNLQVKDIDLPARLLTVVGTGAKSGQTRQIFLNDEAFQTLVTWLNHTGNTEHVFPSPRTGKRLTKDGIKSTWEAIRKKAGLPELTIHELRHTFGTRLAQNRVDLVTIKELMGHETLDTTAKYLHTSNELKLKAVMGLRNEA